MWDTEKEHGDGTDPVQIPRKHKRALKKVRFVSSSSNWTVLWADVWAGETNPRHWLRTTLVTVSIPPKEEKQRAATGKRPIWQSFCGSTQRKELERKANILGMGLTNVQNIKMWTQLYQQLSWKKPFFFLFCQISPALPVSLRETSQLGRTGSLIVCYQLLETRYLR